MSGELYQVRSLSSLDPQVLYIRQGDTSTLKFMLLSYDGARIAGLRGKALISKDGEKCYEKDIAVQSDDTVSFSIDKVLPTGKYELELIIGSKQKFPSRYYDFTVLIQPSAEYNDEKIIERYGKNELIAEILPQVREGRKGDQGIRGEKGESIVVQSTSRDSNGNTVIAFSDGSKVTVPKGDKGDSIRVASTAKTPEGDLEVTFSDGSIAVVPKGPKGDKGKTGDVGEQGPPGPVYDDSALQQQIDRKQDELTAGANVTISENTIIAKDTVYDDTELRLAIKSLPRKFATYVGDGSKSEYVIQHDLGTRDVVVALYQGTEPYEEYLFEVYRLNDNQVKLVASRAIKQNEFRVVVIG